MKILLKLLFLLLFLLCACGKPTAHVYQDKTSLTQEMLKFCLLGGVGQGSLIQQNVADSLGEEKCDQVYFLGDLVSGPAITSLEDPDLLDKFLSYYQPLFYNKKISRINLILGQNEYQGDPNIWLEIGSKYEGIFFPNFYYMTNYGGLCIVALDSNVFLDSAYIAQALLETAWMIQLKEDLKSCKVKVALSHHPYKGETLLAAKDIDWRGSQGSLKLFLDTYVIGKMQLHVSAHVKALTYDGAAEDTTLLISGMGGEVTQTSDTPGFIVLVWNADSPTRVGYRIKRLPVLGNGVNP
jgi:hypothetical protein